MPFCDLHVTLKFFLHDNVRLVIVKLSVGVHQIINFERGMSIEAGICVRKV